MDLYNIGKTPLALALGFGEVTINRYFNRQVPSKEYSDIMRAALYDVGYFKHLLDSNKEKVGDFAYSKALVAIESIQKQFSKMSGQLLAVIATIFAYSSDITPLALQKLLYYINNIHRVKYGKKVFNDACEAWVHGPVYRDVYYLFKGFKYNPIDDARIHLLKGCDEHLPEYTKEIIYNVLATFGMYSGKALETITHGETPWTLARDGYLPSELGYGEISEEILEEYFKEKNAQYNLATISGMNCYIKDMLKNS